MPLTQVGDAALEAPEEIPDAVDGAGQCLASRGVDELFHRQADHLRALAVPNGSLPVEFFEEALG